MSMVPYGISVLTLFIFLFVTPTGLLAVYLVTSGTVRAVAAYTDVDDARGRFRVVGRALGMDDAVDVSCPAPLPFGVVLRRSTGRKAELADLMSASPVHGDAERHLA